VKESEKCVTRHIPLLLLALVFTAACGDSPTAPSVNSSATGSQSAVTGSGPSATNEPRTSAGEPSAGPATSDFRIEGPRGIIPDCLHAEQLPDVLEWRIYGVPESAKVDKGYNHDDTSGCGFTEQHLRTENDHLRYLRDPGNPTTLIVRFDKGTYTCGRSQIDISIDGINVLGEVLDYGSDCVPPATPACDASGGYIIAGALTVDDKPNPPGEFQVYVRQYLRYRNVIPSHRVDLYWRNPTTDPVGHIKESLDVLSPCDNLERETYIEFVGFSESHRKDHGAQYSMLGLYGSSE
jgi:hypothetical protein